MANPVFFPSTTPNFNLPMLIPGQAQKEFFVNQAFAMIDSVAKRAILGSMQNPPETPGEGSSYRVTAPATGDWEGKEDAIACYIAGAWQFLVPYNGMTVFDQAAGRMLHFNGSWRSANAPASASGGTHIDQEARQALEQLVSALKAIGIFADID